MVAATEAFIEVDTDRAIVGGRAVIDRPATEWLINAEAGERIRKACALIETRKLLPKIIAYHRECWATYLKRTTLPASWRGRFAINHYERIIFGLYHVVRPEPGHGARVKRQRWFRHAPRDQQQAALAWLKSLPPDTAAMLAQSYRHDDAARRAEERHIARINREQVAKLDNVRKHSGRH